MLTSIVFAIGVHAVVVEKNIEAVMRDGVVLRADIYRPDEAGRFPALLKRTPYSKGDSSDQPLYRRLASEGFVVAVQDTRGPTHRTASPCRTTKRKTDTTLSSGSPDSPT